MSDLISREKLKAHYAWWKGGSREMTMDEAKSDFDCIIDLQPTVEAEPVKHGFWHPVTVCQVYQCTCCKSGIMTGHIKEYYYCPNCGAKMSLEEQEEPEEVLHAYIKREEIE